MYRRHQYRGWRAQRVAGAGPAPAAGGALRRRIQAAVVHFDEQHVHRYS